MNALFFLAIFSMSALAQDYTLYAPENEHYRTYSRDELIQRLGTASSLLVNYQCNFRDEVDPFWPAIRQKTLATSLKIKIPQSDEMYIYREGVFYKLNGEVQNNFRNEFLKAASDSLEKIEAFPKGQFLLRELERSFFPITIAKGGNMFNPKDDEGRNYRGIYRANALAIFAQGRMTSEDVPFNNIGAGGTIAWNPDTTEVSPHIALAHEMYHAFDSIRGLLDMRFVHGPKFEFTSLSEYRAVYFENMMRKFSGIEYRTHYGEDHTGPGVLDEQGEPRKMPTPCLEQI
jgi:hypothetical protein